MADEIVLKEEKQLEGRELREYAKQEVGWRNAYAVLATELNDERAKIVALHSNISQIQHEVLAIRQQMTVLQAMSMGNGATA